jgi:hypothetical protein
MKYLRFFEKIKKELQIDDYVWYNGDVPTSSYKVCPIGIYIILSIDDGPTFPYYIRSITEGGEDFVKKFQVDDSGEEYSQWVNADEIEYISDNYKDLDMFLDMKKYNI